MMEVSVDIADGTYSRTTLIFVVFPSLIVTFLSEGCKTVLPELYGHGCPKRYPERLLVLHQYIGNPGTPSRSAVMM